MRQMGFIYINNVARTSGVTRHDADSAIFSQTQVVMTSHITLHGGRA
jgi:hypothetical protein